MFGYELVLVDAIVSRGDVVENTRKEKGGERRKITKKPPSYPKAFILKNAIQNQKWINSIKSKDDLFNPHRGLLLAIFGFLYLSKGWAKEGALLAFLAKLGLVPGSHHPIFGNIKEQIVTFTKQQFLHRRKVGEHEFDQLEYEVQLGPRALKLIDEKEICDFLAAILEVDVCDLAALDSDH